MKLVIAMFEVLAITAFCSVVFAAEVTVDGAVALRSRDFSVLSLDKDNPTKNVVDTQEKIMVQVNANSGEVKAKISIWNDFNSWGGTHGGFEHTQGTPVGGNGFSGITQDGSTGIGIREAWMLFPLADSGFFVEGGHLLMQLGNGMFFRSQHFGSDAWIVSRDDGPNYFGFVNVKVSEGRSVTAATNSAGTTTATSPATANADDVDAYVIVDTYKFNDTTKVGLDLTIAQDRKNRLGFSGGSQPTDARNLGLNYAGKVGPVDLKAQADVQTGRASKANADGDASTAEKSAKLKGSNLYIRGDIPMDQVSGHITIDRGSGPKKNQGDFNQFLTFLDIDQHYTFIYEYQVAGACGYLNQGFCNTTAWNAGAKYEATKNLTVGADVWLLRSTEMVNDKKWMRAHPAVSTNIPRTNDLGTEIDLTLAWTLAETLVWNWNAGMLAPGAGLGFDTATGIQGILTYTF